MVIYAITTMYRMSEDTVVADGISGIPYQQVEQMIARTIESNHGFGNVIELYNALPCRIPHSIFYRVLTNLEKSSKVGYDRDGAVFWIFAGDKPELIELLKNSVELKYQ